MSKGVSVIDVTKQYHSMDGSEVVALHNVNLHIEPGEFVAIVGSSGCGKSTLLRTICGLLKPTSGSVKVNDQVVNEPLDDTAMVFQTPTLLPWSTILDNVLFPLRMRGKMQSSSAEYAMSLLKLVGLQGFEHKYPRELSGGMQQRAGICRGLVQNPSVLLMDEPFGALDALTREEMSMELLRIWTEQPKTVVFVTHSITEAVLLSDRVVVMSPRPGRVVEVIPIQLERPRNFDQLGDTPARQAMHRIREIIYADQKTGSNVNA